jgi:hypothetical protein
MKTTLGVTALAGAGHVLFTIILGLIVARAGKEAAKLIPPAVEHAFAVIALIILGVTFLIRGMRRSGCQHPGHHHMDEHAADPVVAAPGAVGALIMGMTLSPCVDLLSIYLAAAAYPWPVVAAVSAILAVTTLTLMLTFVWLTLHGLRMLRLDWLERNEGFVVAGILFVLAAFILFAH